MTDETMVGDDVEGETKDIKKGSRPPNRPLPAGPPDEEEELLMDGQEEVFSRAEIENGVIEHKADT